MCSGAWCNTHLDAWDVPQSCRVSGLHSSVLRQARGQSPGQGSRQTSEPSFLSGKVSKWLRRACLGGELSARRFWHLPGSGSRQRHSGSLPLGQLLTTRGQYIPAAWEQPKASGFPWWAPSVIGGAHARQPSQHRLCPSALVPH